MRYTIAFINKTDGSEMETHKSKNLDGIRRHIHKRWFTGGLCNGYGMNETFRVTYDGVPLSEEEYSYILYK